MKKVVIFLCVLVALVIGGAAGWALRGTQTSAPLAGSTDPDTSTGRSVSSQQADDNGQCVADGLTAQITPAEGGAAAGSRYYSLTVMNSRNVACTINGYPGVSLLNAGGETVGSPAEKDTATAPSSVSLAPNETATATIRIAESGNYPAGTCKEGVVTVKTYPPNDTGFLSVPTDTITTWCPGFTTTAFAKN